jgi:tetratricopeptide (TPR) repeat protein
VPNDANSHFNRGFVLEQGGCSREAIAAFVEAVRLNPALDRAWYGMGMAQARLGEHAEAAAAFAKAAELQPMSGEVYYQWGMACHHAFQPDEVTKVVKHLVGFDPKRAMKLIKDAERPDLARLVPEEGRRFFETYRG